MKNLVMVLCIISLSGCAGFNLKTPERWATSDVFYSTKLPALKLTINDDTLHFNKMTENGSVRNSISGSMTTGVDTSYYYFKGFEKQIRIKIETVQGRNWYASKPTYTKKSVWGIKFQAETKNIIGKNYVTAVLCKKKTSKTHLVKAYGAVFGENVRFQIFYMEVVPDTWLSKNPNFLSQKDHEFINNFTKRADSSFSIQPFSANMDNSTEQPKETLSKSELKRQLSSNSIENDLVVQYPELSTCYSTTKANVLKLLKKSKTKILDDLFIDLPKTITPTIANLHKGTLPIEMMDQFIRSKSNDYSLDYLPLKDQKMCQKFKDYPPML